MRKLTPIWRFAAMHPGDQWRVEPLFVAQVLTDDRLLPCPFCGVPLEIRSGKNPYGRHPRDSECIMAAHAVNIPYDVARWNRRAAASTSTDEAPDGWKGSKQDFDLCYNATPEQIAASLEKQRHDLTNLPENWDGYGAHPLPAATVDAMLADLEIEGGVVDLVPGADGSIQAEWHRRGNVDIEYRIDVDGKRSLYVKIEAASTSTEGAGVKGLTPDDVEWVVNDIAELGVKIGNQFFFLYKGCSLVYGWLDPDPTKPPMHDDGTPMHWRPVFKREFGECAHPINYKNLNLIGTVSLGDSDEWKPIPAALNPPAPKVTTDEAEGRG